MLYSEQMRGIIEKLGLDPNECKDGLYSTLMQKIVEACGSGSGGGVSSWNDLTDKPFYTEKGATVLPETAVVFDPDSGEGAIIDTIAVEAGKPYVVNWNGTEYTCAAVNFDLGGVLAVTIGNIGAASGGESTGEPFVITAFPDDVAAQMGVGAMCVALDGSTSATVSISGDIVKPIDIKYLPSEAVRRMVVKFTNEDGASISADKTFEEVKAAYSSGYDVIGFYTVNHDNGIEEHRVPLVSHMVIIDATGAESESFMFSVFGGQSTSSAHGISIRFANSGILLTETVIS